MQEKPIKDRSNTRRVGFRVEEKLMNKLRDFSDTKDITISELCRRIITDYFYKKEYESIVDLASKLEMIMPDLEEHARDYKAMKEVLKETVNAVYDNMSEIKEMKKGHFLTYKTLQIQKESFEKFITVLSGKV